MSELLNSKLRELYSAEVQILDTLPKLIELSTSERLIDAIKHHTTETKNHVKRLDAIDAVTHFKGTKHVNKTMQTMLSEAEKKLTAILDPYVRNVAIACAIQQVEHYEIAGYGCAAEFAFQLDHVKEAGQLVETLDEEKNADATINSIAKGGLFTKGLNEKAIDENGS